VSKPTWASDPAGGFSEWTPGTINLVVQLPVALTGGAAVNAVTTATEAKTQALLDCKVPGTGTASDAVVVTWPSSGEAQPFAGPRSEWGARIAQAAYAAVKVGVEDWTGRHTAALFDERLSLRAASLREKPSESTRERMVE